VASTEPGVATWTEINFTNILWAGLCPNFLLPIKESQTQILNTQKLCKTLSYEKAAHKMIVKLTPVVNFTNILQAVFFSIIFRQKIAKLNCN